MMTTATHSEHYNAHAAHAAVLCMAFELSEKTWKRGFTLGHGQKPRDRTIAARDPKRILAAVRHAKGRFGLPDTAPVVRGYEAGRAGFGLHRCLPGQGSTSQVVASSSIEGKRRKRRAKSEALDGRQVVRMLRRSHHGERQGWRGVHVPAVDAEAHRHRHRDLATLKQDRARTTHRIKGVLRSQGVRRVSVHKLPDQRDALRLWDGAPLPKGLRRRGLRVDPHSRFLSEQSAAWEAERRALLRRAQEATIEEMRQWRPLQGIGIKGAGLVVMACVGWRACKKRREVGG